LEACNELGRPVPEEIAVVGADDDEAYCLLAHPPLASMAAEQIGFVAATKLAMLLEGKAPEASAGTIIS
jgi:DNA-binding LacI/PurR family transcriptional regulator